MAMVMLTMLVPLGWALQSALPASRAACMTMPRTSVSMHDKITQGKVHGEGGAYVGGYWVDIDDCGNKFNIADGSNEVNKELAPCPRSRTRHSAARDDGTYDVAIIGAGCIGAAIARELAKTTASVILLESGDDVCQGATKGNSGIVHAGFDDKPGTNRARLCWKGNQMFAELDEQLHFGYQLTGSLVCARGAEEEQHLQELLERGHTNGVKNLSIIKGDELRRMEPHLDPAFTAALHSPDAGTLIPYEYTIALAENAVDNGVEARIRRAVKGIRRVAAGSQSDDGTDLFELDVSHWEPREYCEQRWRGDALGVYEGGADEGGPWKDYPELVRGKQAVTVEDMKVGGSGSQRAMDGIEVAREKVHARFVVNAAGGASDKIARMVGDSSFTIKPRLGEYVLLKKSQGDACNHILFPCPGKYGKGVLVQKTLWGNVILGPTARDVHDWADPNHDPEPKEEVLRTILSACRRLVPGFDVSDSFHSFAGARAKSSRGDWILERCFAEGSSDGRLVHAAGIDSPGIAGSPAIALELVELLRQAGLETQPDPLFNPRRAANIVPKQGDEGLVYTPDDKTSINALNVAAEANVVCKCEKVTEAEIVEACRRGLPVDSTQAIRKRTRAGMGGCQGKPWNYGCECRVAQIIEREAGQPARGQPTAGRRPWSATSLFPRRWITDDDKAMLQRVSALPAQEDEPSELDDGLLDKLDEALPLRTPTPKTVVEKMLGVDSAATDSEGEA